MRAQFVKSKTGKDMLKIFLDIAEGEFAGHFDMLTTASRRFNPQKEWDSSGTYWQLLADYHNPAKISGGFKALIDAVEVSNNYRANYSNFEDYELNGKLVGFVFGEEEYQKQDETVGTTVKPKFPKAVEDIRTDNFKVPPIKKLKQKPPEYPTEQPKDDDFGGTPIDPEDTPF